MTGERSLPRIANAVPTPQWGGARVRRTSGRLDFLLREKQNMISDSGHAGVAQSVEHQLPKLRVEGSNPFARSSSQDDGYAAGPDLGSGRMAVACARHPFVPPQERAFAPSQPIIPPL